MTITGKYSADEKFISDTIARNSSEWGRIKVGDRIATGHILNRATFEKWKSECTKEGTFELSE